MSSSDNVHTIVEHAATDDVPCEECGGDTMAPYRDARGHVHEGYYCEGCGWTTRPDVVELVERACGDAIVQTAKDRLVEAVRSHNDGRVRRFLSIAATARETATTDVDDQRWAAWSRNLHAALDESWPIGHPGYRRHEG